MHLYVEFSKSAMVIGIVYGCIFSKSQKPIVKRISFTNSLKQTNAHFKAQLCSFLAISFAHQC